MKNKRMLISGIYILLGMALFGCGLAEIVDEFWSGMGGALIGVGIVRMISMIRYQKNPEYKEAVDTAMRDERNRFIANKAWAWAGYLYVLAAGVGTIVFKLVGREDLSIFCGFSVSVLILLYYISHLWLRKKY